LRPIALTYEVRVRWIRVEVKRLGQLTILRSAVFFDTITI